MSAATSFAPVKDLHPEQRSVGSYDPERKPTPTTEQYAGYEAAFAHFNAELFGGALPPAMLTLAKSGRSFGYYIGKRWRGRGEEEGRVGEIALSPEHLARDERALAATLVHEMVHHWQQVEGTPSRRGYHNKEWGARMESIGLMPSSTGAPDGKRTGQRMSHYVIEGGAFADAFEKLDRAVLLPFIADSAAPKDKPASDPSKTKFTCPVCGDSARGKPALMISCDKCGVRMVRDGAGSAPAPSAEEIPASKVDGPIGFQADDEHEEAVDWGAIDSAFSDGEQAAP